MTKEMIEKAKTAKTPAELIAMAKEAGIAESTEEEAKAYFEQLHAKTGEMPDDELDNVSGGACYHDGYMVTTAMSGCDKWKCVHCGGDRTRNGDHKCGAGGTVARWCNACKYCIYKDALWLCKHPENMKNN